MPPNRRQRADPRRFFGTLGFVAMVLVAAVAYIAFTANSGLPWQRSYAVEIEVPSANRLIAASDVRIGGNRVGQIMSVTAVPSRGGGPPSARVTLALDTSLRPLPADTTARVRPASVLGATYLDLEPGSSRRGLRQGEALPLRQATAAVELTDLLDIFDRSTARNLQDTLTGGAVGFAGRGAAVNSTLGSLNTLLPRLTAVAGRLAAPRTRLARFIAEYESTLSALEPVSPQLGGLVTGGARTFAAVADERAALAAAIEAAPDAVSSTTTAFDRMRPGLDGLARLARELEPAGRFIPRALRGANSALSAGVTPLRRLPRFSRNLSRALTALGSLSRDPTTSGSLRKLRDVAVAAAETLEVLLPAQVHCNVIALWGQNFGDTFGALGSGIGPSLATLDVTTAGASGESLQSARPSPDVAINPIPNENADECESGNEPWTAGKQQLNNPPGLQSRDVPTTVPPPGVLELARRAGLLDEPGGTP